MKFQLSDAGVQGQHASSLCGLADLTRFLVLLLLFLCCWPVGAAEPYPGLHGKNSFRHRENVTVRLSYDDCQTWPVSRVLEPGISGYTDLAVDPDGTDFCVYERGGDDGFAHKHLTIA